MALPKNYTGYGLALGYHVISALGAIAVKLFMNASSVETTMFFWYLSGSVLTLGLLVYRRRGFDFSPLIAKLSLYLTISGVMVVAVVTWFLSVELAGPGVAAFVSQLGIVFSVLLGAFVLGERFTRLDALGGTVAILGAFVLMYRSGDAVVTGALLGIISAFGSAFHGLLVKRHIARIDKVDLLFVRSVVICLLVWPWSAVAGGRLATPPVWLLALIFVGAGVAHVLGNLALYSALGYIDLAKVYILTVIQPVVAMAGAFFILQQEPTTDQLLGSGLILFGVAFILVQPLLSAQRAASESG